MGSEREELRKIKLKIGKRSYNLQTALDDDAVERVAALTSEIAGKLDEFTPQEERLALVCMTLAWKLERATAKMKLLAETMDKLK